MASPYKISRAAEYAAGEALTQLIGVISCKAASINGADLRSIAKNFVSNLHDKGSKDWDEGTLDTYDGAFIEAFMQRVEPIARLLDADEAPSSSNTLHFDTR